MIYNILNWIIKYLYLSYMTICSTSLLVTVYLIKSSYQVWNVGTEYDELLNIATFILVPVLLSLVSVFLTLLGGKDSINKDVKVIAPANNDYLSIYVGYFFVALSIPNSNAGQCNWAILMALYLLICSFILCSKVYYFNPILFFFGYSFYNIETSNGVRLFIISKKKIGKGCEHIIFPHLRRITNFVYLEENGNDTSENKTE